MKITLRAYGMCLEENSSNNNKNNDDNNNNKKWDAKWNLFSKDWAI